MDGDTFLRQAYDAIFHGDFESAVQYFQQAIEQEPDNSSLYYKASITCARSGKMTLAEGYAKRAVELDPENPDYALHDQMIAGKQAATEARHLLGSAVPDPVQAKRLLSHAEALDPLAVETKLLLGLACRMQGDLHSAIRYFRDTLQLDPQLEEAKRLLQEARIERRRMIRSQTNKRNR